MVSGAELIQTLRKTIDSIIQSPIRVQFAVLAGLILLLGVIGTLIAGLTLDFKQGWSEAFWWTFVRIADPGYLGDDSGFWEKLLSTSITFAGWIAFGGILISIFTTAMEERLGQIRAGRAKVRSTDHTVILGWNGTVFSVLDHLLHQNHKAEAILVLADSEVTAMKEAVDSYCPDLDPERIVFRQGAIESLQELQDLRLAEAKRVIILGSEQGQRLDAGSIYCAIQVWESIKKERSTDKEPLACHLHIDDLGLFSAFRLVSVFPDAQDRFEPIPFNFYHNWARRILAQYPLDRKPIAADDMRQVHLVIVGLGQMGEALALQAAKQAHFANGSRAWLSIIDRDAESLGRRLQARYPGIETVVDLELINHDLEDPMARQSLCQWVCDERALVTIALCMDNSTQAFSYALRLPGEICEHDVPVLLRLGEEAGLMELLQRTPDLAHIHPFGMLRQGWDPEERLDILAKAIHQDYLEYRRRLAAQAEAEGTPYQARPNERPWNRLDPEFKLANRQMADHYDIKLRAVGCERVAEITEDFAFSEAEVELLAAMEHTRWRAERLLAGWRYGRQRDDGKKIHDGLIDYERLPETVKAYNRATVRNIPRLLSERLGMGIRRIQSPAENTT